ncbi:MAG: DUF4167 domain-containing protein [Pseudomonadota bacterium]
MRQGSNNRRSRGRNNGRRNGLPNKNQTFESSGPESHIRIRGNATQVQEKYMSLARDALNSGDRILAENFFQHAEHYYRVMGTLNEAHAQAAAEQQNNAPQRQPEGQESGWSNGHMRNGRGRPNGEQPQEDESAAKSADGSSPFASDPRDPAAEQPVNGGESQIADAGTPELNGSAAGMAAAEESGSDAGEPAAPVERQVRTRRRTTRSRRATASQREEAAPATESE